MKHVYMQILYFYILNLIFFLLMKSHVTVENFIYETCEYFISNQIFLFFYSKNQFFFIEWQLIKFLSKENYQIEFSLSLNVLLNTIVFLKYSVIKSIKIFYIKIIKISIYLWLRLHSIRSFFVFKIH